MAVYKKFVDLGISVANNIPSLLSRQSTLNYQRCAMISHRAMEKKLGLPPRPKRPVTPYIKFTIEQRPILTAKHPEKSMTDLMKIMAESWRLINNEEKEKLREQYKKQLEEYTKDAMTHDENLTEEQKQMLKEERAKRVDRKEKNKMKSKMKELGRPKKPPTPFVLFMVSRLKSKPKDVVFPSWLSSVAKEWASLSPEEKYAVKIEANKLMDQYKDDVVVWETKMIKMGHIDLVRSRRLLDLKGTLDVPTPEETTT